jgi:ribosomal protein L37AE/L43A
MRCPDVMTRGQLRRLQVLTSIYDNRLAHWRCRKCQVLLEELAYLYPTPLMTEEDQSSQQASNLQALLA